MPAGGVLLDGVEHRHRFAVGERHDEVGLVGDEAQHVLGLAGVGLLDTARQPRAASMSPGGSPRPHSHDASQDRDRGEWLAARKDLLAKEKELTRQRDALNVERRELPMVEVDEDYAFAGPEGQCG